MVIGIDFFIEYNRIYFMLGSVIKPFSYDNKDWSHDGLKGITYYLYKNAVPINIHGHIHTSYLDTLKNGTQVKGVYECEVITIKGGRIESKT